ncbi:radical SAM/SPASM domain-containing protein [Thaumasiovibrio subtropicus]|uniref:radical SAM/SPASM domain-containing protein n=1 Tax=Thaumasiovibrio subtropicus TaxID=1891207 RepID=UPI000B364028|nr:SPASM domain-containing protein [Thaumasiovibrio subtropicus]
MNSHDSKFIHLLYAPTNYCNMGCQYCYLGDGTNGTPQTKDLSETLRYTVGKLLEADIVPFNISLHGGEPTAIPKPQLEALFRYCSHYYAVHRERIHQAGFAVNPLHIKTNLYNFDRIQDICEAYKVSISGSVDLPLSLHAQYRTDKKGRSTLDKTLANLKLLAKYPHNRKISCVVTKAHMAHIDQFIDDIWFIHRDIGLDMTKFNVMFSFDSVKNQEKFPIDVPEMLTQQEQVRFYHRIKEAFVGTELEAGLNTHWFKEFTPEYCCSAVNCGDKFFMLQENGDVYACPRGQSSRDFFYGNVFESPVKDIIANGSLVIEANENQLVADTACFECEYLPYCNQGCVFVRHQTLLTKSYTCLLQKTLYRDNPERYPPYDADYISQYATAYKFRNNIQSFSENQVRPTRQQVITPELYQAENHLAAIIAEDKMLQNVYHDQLFYLSVDGMRYALVSPVLNTVNDLANLNISKKVCLHVRKDALALNSKDPVNNAVYLMLLRNTMVSYGDEGRTKQEHLTDYTIYDRSLQAMSEEGGEYWVFDLTAFFQSHAALFLKDVRNNLFVTTKALREYHYSKQKNNAFYHIQAINLPFPFIEFYWDEKVTPMQDQNSESNQLDVEVVFD